MAEFKLSASLEGHGDDVSLLFTLNGLQRIAY